MRYELYGTKLQWLASGSRKSDMIAQARKMTQPATVIDLLSGGIIYENAAQQTINEATHTIVDTCPAEHAYANVMDGVADFAPLDLIDII